MRLSMGRIGAALLFTLLASPASFGQAPWGAPNSPSFLQNASVPISVAVTTSSSTPVLLPAGATVIIQNTGSEAAAVAFGNSSVAATTTDFQIAGGGWQAFAVPPNTYVAAITSASTATLNITAGSGLPTGSGGGIGGGGGPTTVNIGTSPNFVAGAGATSPADAAVAGVSCLPAGQQLANGQSGAAQGACDNSALLTAAAPSADLRTGIQSVMCGPNVSYCILKLFPGELYAYSVYCSTFPYYAQYFDEATNVAPTGAPTSYEPISIGSPGGSSYGQSPPKSFLTGITLAASSTAATFTANATCTFTVQYK